MTSTIRHFFDPLRLHCFLNILGDIFIITSGMSYGNLARILAATCGASTHFIGILFSKKTIFGKPPADIVMSILILCGFLYLLSGSNLLRFEETPRYTEMLGGLSLAAAAFGVIKGKNKLSPILFTFATTFFSLSAIEVFIVRGEGDWFVLLGAIMFYLAGFVTAFIKKEKVQSS